MCLRSNISLESDEVSHLTYANLSTAVLTETSRVQVRNSSSQSVQGSTEANADQIEQTEVHVERKQHFMLPKKLLARLQRLDTGFQ